MRHAIDSRIRKLDGFFARASAVDDDELKSDLSKLGAVLACGFVERSVEIIVLDRISYRAHPRVQSFVKSYFKKGTNYDCEAICKLLERFDLAWSQNMRSWIDANDGAASSLISIYALRNSIAHGGDNSSSLVRVKALYDDCKVVVEAAIVSTQVR